MDLSFEGLLSIQGIFTLLMLILLQAVLGFDNLLYISLESKRVEESKQSYVRKMGVGLAIFLRIGLLIVLLLAIDKMRAPFVTFGLDIGDQIATTDHPADDHSFQHEHKEFSLNDNGSIVAGSFNVHSIIVLLGGIFIIYTAFKEIMHMLHIPTTMGRTRTRSKHRPWLSSGSS